jgi:outer membrane protein assembly factor BamB
MRIFKQLTLILILLNSCNLKEDNSNSTKLNQKSELVNNNQKNERDSELKANSNNVVQPSKIIERENNIFVIMTDGSTKQLTFNQSDIYPILLPNNTEVVYVRVQNMSGYKSKKIMIVDINDLKERVLTDQKPYLDGLDGTSEILTVDNPILSTDGNSILFVTEKYATGNQLVKVDLKTGKWTELFPAETFEQLTISPFKGHYLVGQSDIGENGRGTYYRLVDSKGNIVKKFNDERSMMNFKIGLK